MRHALHITLPTGLVPKVAMPHVVATGPSQASPVSTMLFPQTGAVAWFDEDEQAATTPSAISEPAQSLTSAVMAKRCAGSRQYSRPFRGSRKLRAAEHGVSLARQWSSTTQTFR